MLLEVEDQGVRTWRTLCLLLSRVSKHAWPCGHRTSVESCEQPILGWKTRHAASSEVTQAQNDTSVASQFLDVLIDVGVRESGCQETRKGPVRGGNDFQPKLPYIETSANVIISSVFKT